VVLSTSATNYAMHEPVDVVVTLSDQNGAPAQASDLTVVAESPAGDSISVALTPDADIPGRYHAQFSDLPPGSYRLRPAGEAVDRLAAGPDGAQNFMETAVVTIESPGNVELADSSANHALLQEITQLTGGQVIPPTAVAEALELSAAGPRIVENTSRVPLWNKWRYLWAIGGCLALEWGIRRRIGVV
jgi:hypothetical protein